MSESPKDREEGQKLLRLWGSEDDKEEQEQIRDLRSRHPNIPSPDFAEVILGLGPVTLGEFMLCWLCWRRYGITVRQLIREYNDGSPDASKKLTKLIQDYEQWRLGKFDPNRMKFKIDPDHHLLIEFGLGLGLERLSEDEMADCFDALCPCGKEHSPEALKKLRTRIIRQLADAGGFPFSRD